MAWAQRGLRRWRRLSLVVASMCALLGVVACGYAVPSYGPRYSVFAQPPQQGSGEAIDLASAAQIHPLWAYQPGSGYLESITNAAGALYVSYESDISALGPVGTVSAGSNGNLGTMTPLPSPTVSRETVSVLEALDAHSGRRLWRFQVAELSDNGAEPLVANETVYLALAYHVCAVNAHSGVARWCAPVIDPTQDAEYLVDGELAVANGMLFVGAYHTLIAVDAATGKRIWSVQTPMRSSHLATGNDLVYVSAADGQLSAFAAKTGQQMWVAKQTPYYPDLNPWASAPYFDNGTLYAVAGQTVVAYEGRRGAALWRLSLDDGQQGTGLWLASPAPVFATVAGTPYLLAEELKGSSTQLVAYNLQTHQRMWSKPLPGQSGLALAVGADVIYVASETADHPYPMPTDRHIWLSMLDLRSGQVARQLQSNDDAFEARQLVAADGLLIALGRVLDGGASPVYALGR